MFADISTLEAFDDKLYIFDNVTNFVYVFSMDGRFLFVLNNVGQGPGEYTQIDFFSIDRNERQMVVADLITNHILRYDLNGKFVSKQKVPCWVDGVYPIENKDVVLLTNYRDNSETIENQQNILFIDSLSNVLSGYFPYPSEEISKVKFSTLVNGGFYYGGNVCNYFNMFQDTVYSVLNKTLIPKYVFDFGDKKFDKSYLEKDPSLLEDYIESRKYMSLRSLNETDDYLFYTIAYGYFNYDGLFSKKTKNNILSMIRYDVEDQVFGYHVATCKSSVIFSVPVEALLSKKENCDKNGWPKGKFADKKKKFIESLSEDDNPVLVFYEFDNF